MNILIPHGFEANYTLGFVKGLAANGVSVSAISCDETQSRLSRAGIANINLRGSQTESRSRLTKSLTLLRYYARLLLHLARHRGGTFHFTGIFRNEFVLIEGVALNLGIKLFAGRYIYTAHNVLPHNREGDRFFKRVYRFVYRIPDIVVVHTEQVREQLINEFQVPDAKIRVISIGLNEEVPDTGMSKSQARGLVGFDDTVSPILFFGRIDEYKGVDILIDAFGGLGIPRARLLVAGTFKSEEYKEQILSLIAASPRGTDIRLDPRMVPNDEVESLFKACDVLCLPYRNIYQSGLFFLGSRFGIPMVVTNVGSLGQFVTPEIGLIAPSNDAEGVRNALVSYFSDPGRFKAETIISTVEKYRWVHTCAPLIPLYESGGSPNVTRSTVSSASSKSS